MVRRPPCGMASLAFTRSEEHTSELQSLPTRRSSDLDVLPWRDLDALVVRGVQCHVTRRDGQTPTLWHGIPCVHRQVHDDLLNLTSISPHCTDLGVEIHHCFDIFSQQTWQHFRQVLHYVAKIEDSWFEHLFPTVSQ